MPPAPLSSLINEGGQMPEPMTEGIDLDPTVLIAVQNERIAAAAIREAQLTAAVQQLTMEKMRLEEVVGNYEYLERQDAIVEDGDASADDTG